MLHHSFSKKLGLGMNSVFVDSLSTVEQWPSKQHLTTFFLSLNRLAVGKTHQLKVTLCKIGHLFQRSQSWKNKIFISQLVSAVYCTLSSFNLIVVVTFALYVGFLQVVFFFNLDTSCVASFKSF